MKIYPGLYKIGDNFPEGSYLLKRQSGYGRICFFKKDRKNFNYFEADFFIDLGEHEEKHGGLPEAVALGSLQTGNYLLVEGTLVFESEETSL